MLEIVTTCKNSENLFLQMSIMDLVERSFSFAKILIHDFFSIFLLSSDVENLKKS